MTDYQLKTPKSVEKLVTGTYEKIRDGVVDTYEKLKAQLWIVIRKLRISLWIPFWKKQKPTKLWIKKRNNPQLI